MASAAAMLAERDDDLGRLFEAHGVPPLWAKGPGFETLVEIVLGQQVSLDSARAALERLRRAAGALTPEGIAALGEEGLRAAGQTRQKAAYLAGLSRASLTGRLDLERIDTLADDAAVDSLVAHRGIGRWTADIYLLMGLGRPDIWPSSDLAIIVAARQLHGVGPDASPAVITAAAERWRPHRSVAARMLWQDYLLRRGRPLDP